VGLRVPFTKQESQTRVPSFRVKSTRRVGSISAPHFPQRSSLRLLRSSFGSAIDSPGCHRFHSSIKRITRLIDVSVGVDMGTRGSLGANGHGAPTWCVQLLKPKHSNFARGRTFEILAFCYGGAG
jgi:hypothetical protein